MKISYLVTCNTEIDTLKKLIQKIYNNLGSDEMIILQDETNWNLKRKKYLADITELNPTPSKIISLPILIHPLNNDYGAHKNFGIQQCNGDYIFQLDGDEMPPETLLGENLHIILESNPNIEAYAVPRINAWIGLTEEHAKQWGWPLDVSPTYNRLRAAWPDYQWRIFKRDYPRIAFKKRLHEKIEGYKSYSALPMDEQFALYHDKTIEKQIETNMRYNKDFTTEENRGISSKIK